MQGPLDLAQPLAPALVTLVFHHITIHICTLSNEYDISTSYSNDRYRCLYWF